MNSIKNDFTHLVLFWLNEPENEEHRSRFEKALKKLMNDSVYSKGIQVGKPVPSDRDVVENSYTYSLMVLFDSEAELEKYQTEPAHLAFLESCKPLWNRVQVFDSESLL